VTAASHRYGDERGSSMYGLRRQLLIFGARWLSRVTFLGGIALLLATAAGWTA
jgi:hypothetical protein